MFDKFIPILCTRVKAIMKCVTLLTEKELHVLNILNIIKNIISYRKRHFMYLLAHVVFHYFRKHLYTKTFENLRSIVSTSLFHFYTYRRKS